MKWDEIFTHSIPNDKDLLMTSEEQYAFVHDVVVCMCDEKLCVESISQASGAMIDIFSFVICWY